MVQSILIGFAVAFAVIGLLAYPRTPKDTNHKRTMAKFRAIERFSSF